MPTQLRGQLDGSTKLDRVERRSRQDRNTVFNNLGHIIELDLLRRCFADLDGSKAVGIDGVTKEGYGKNLEGNLRELLLKIRRGSYHPRAARIVEIPKADGSRRPLAIACFEDKIVQEAVRRIVERIYEPIFLAVSHGFRPGRGCDTALVNLRADMMRPDCGAVLEIDLRKYFNTIPHDRLIELLKRKIADERFLRLIIKLMKAPYLTADGHEERNSIGSPQGSILSPVLANLYLHYVLDIWFCWLNGKEYGGNMRMVRYADDAVFTFRSIPDAERFKSQLVERLKQWGIEIHEGKTKILVAGKREANRRSRNGQGMPTFSFLGFLHTWGSSINRKTGETFQRVKLRTDPKRFRKKLLEIKRYIRKHRHDKTLLPKITSVVRGYVNYFAVNDNLRRVYCFVEAAKRFLWKYLNRRSQRKGMTLERLARVLAKLGYPRHIHPRNLFFNLSTAGTSPAGCW